MRHKKSKKPTAVAVAEDSRHCLFTAAKRIFSAKGFDGATIRDLAQEAGVNISLVSYYFKGKEGLYRACLENLSNAGLEAANRILRKPATADEFRTRLQIFLEEWIRLHMNEKEVSNILLRDFTNANPVATEIFVSKFAPIFDILIDFVKSAQKNKIITSEASADVTVLMIMGCVTHLLRVQQIKPFLKEHKTPDFSAVDKVTQQIVQNLCDGVLVRSL